MSVGPRFAVVGALVVGAAAACAPDTGVSVAELADIRAWLTCDDCRSGERDRVRAIGARAVPLLEQAILDFPDDRRENMRLQYGRLWSMMTGPPVDSATFVGRYLTAFDNTVRGRAATSLGDLGAYETLEEALDSAGNLGWSSDQLSGLEASLYRDLSRSSEGTGTADTWALDTPTVGVEVCNGSGGPPCSGLWTVEVRARATFSPPAANPPPWVRVYFYVADAGGVAPPEPLGLVTGPTVTEDLTERRYDWRHDFGAHGRRAGPVVIYAVGVTPAGDARRTAFMTLITVIDGT